MIKSYVCIDLETTGLNPKRDKIIEIGAVRVEEGRQTARMETFVNPGRILPERIIELTGIRDRDLEDAPDIQEVIPLVLDFTEGFPLLGHSVLFDYSFLKKAAVNQRLTFEREGVDTLKIARKYLADLESRSLDALCVYYGIPHKAHRALGDAAAAGSLYETLAGRFETEENGPDFLPRALAYKTKREPPASPTQKERLYKLIEKHGLTVDYDVERLTQSEASSYADRIVAAFGQ